VKRALGSLVSTALLGLGLVLGGAAIAPSAHAHSELVSSDPADGAALDAPPASVSFTFNEDLLPDFVRLIATNPAGVTGDLPISAVEGPTVTAAWPAAEGGEWTVNYRVVSQDGHPIEGGITFSYDGPAPTSSGPLPTSASPDPTTARPTTADPTSATPSPTVSPAADTTTSGIGGWAIAGIAIVLIAVVGVVLAVVMRRRA
jgi:hypothetical protein